MPAKHAGRLGPCILSGTYTYPPTNRKDLQVFLMQGIFINGKRPASKKAVKEAVAADPRSVRIEATSLFGNEYDGPASGMQGSISFVGPDPYSNRKFYGTIKRTGDKIVVS